MKFPEYESYDALGLAALVKKRDVTPLEILDATIERVEAGNPQVNAVVIKAFDQARAAIAAGLPDGPFSGVPYFIKDLHAPVAGLPLSHASRLWQGNVFDFDSETVARLRRAVRERFQGDAPLSDLRAADLPLRFSSTGI